MADESLSISVDATRQISALRTPPPEGTPRWWLVYAPGAGSSLRDGFGAHLAAVLPPLGIGVVRFQFPYMETHSRRPDFPAVLEQTWRAVLAAVSDETPVIASGRSLGGRTASRVVAAGTPVDALALFAYPLHPPGRPDQRRDEHLPRITAPTLFCSGTRDTFATPEELREAAALVPRGTVHILEGADHGFEVLKASGRARTQVWAEASRALIEWLNRLGAEQKQ